MSEAPFTVEVNQSFNPIEKAWSPQIFIKLYTAASTPVFWPQFPIGTGRRFVSSRFTWMRRVSAIRPCRPSLGLWG